MRPARRSPRAREQDELLVVHGWTVLAHPLLLDQLERLIEAAAREQRDAAQGREGPNTKLLAHLADLAFEAIPRDPGNKAFRQGNTLGPSRTHWFRGKTGDGRYRLFYRYDSSSRLIVLAWVNDSGSLRTYGSHSDAYAVFSRMLDQGNPPDSWDALRQAAQDQTTTKRLHRVAAQLTQPKNS